MLSDPFSSDIGAQVLVAFLGDNAHWRTLGGISRASGLTKSEVTRFIQENKDCFVESSITLGGSVLYGMRNDLRQRALEAHRATA